MHAHLKQVEGAIAAMQYCPLDLFSGFKERVETAVEGLWDAWIQSNGSINKLRIFSNGKMVLPNDVSRWVSQLPCTVTDLGVGINRASMVTGYPLITP
jgi:hypothetical protein